eukprot:gene6775-6472_t
MADGNHVIEGELAEALVADAAGAAPPSTPLGRFRKYFGNVWLCLGTSMVFEVFSALSNLFPGIMPYDTAMAVSTITTYPRVLLFFWFSHCLDPTGKWAPPPTH